MYNISTTNSNTVFNAINTISHATEILSVGPNRQESGVVEAEKRRSVARIDSQDDRQER